MGALGGGPIQNLKIIFSGETGVERELFEKRFYKKGKGC
jgi:hypothetical protein